VFTVFGPDVGLEFGQHTAERLKPGQHLVDLDAGDIGFRSTVAPDNLAQEGVIAGFQADWLAVPQSGPDLQGDLGSADLLNAGVDALF